MSRVTLLPDEWRIAEALLDAAIKHPGRYYSIREIADLMAEKSVNVRVYVLRMARIQMLQEKSTPRQPITGLYRLNTVQYYGGIELFFRPTFDA